MDSREIIETISKAKKRTPVKVYIAGKIEKINFGTLENYSSEKSSIIFCEYDEFQNFFRENRNFIENHRIENDRRNSAIPMTDLLQINARIEPGAYIREMTKIGERCIIMMGAVINIGAEIGENTMIDMNAVVGGRAIIGKNCHIGAGAVIAGVIEPPNANPVIIEDSVLVGANAVILEGIRVGKGAVIAAGAVVVRDVESYTVVAGAPAKVIKRVNEVAAEKISLLNELRNL